MRILKVLIRRMYWVAQRFLLPFGVSEFLQKFRPIDNGYSLMRVGGDVTGGYLVPADLDKINVISKEDLLVSFNQKQNEAEES